MPPSSFVCQGLCTASFLKEHQWIDMMAYCQSSRFARRFLLSQKISNRLCGRNRAACAGPGVSSTLPSGCSISGQVLQQERKFYALRNCLCVFLMMIPALYLTSRGGTCWRSFNFTLRCNYDEMCVNSNVSGLKHPVIYYGLSRILINYYVLSF